MSDASGPTWPVLKDAIEKMVAYPAGDGWHVSREAADKALEWVSWAEVHQPAPVPKLLADEDEDLSLTWHTADRWVIHLTFPTDGEPYWLAIPHRATPTALAASTEVREMLAEERAKVWKAVRTAVQLYIDKRSPPQDDEDECQIDVLEQVVATINRAEAAALKGETT